jgi:cell shape-determining protein MreD
MRPIYRLLLIALGSGLLATVSGAFFSAWPAPFGRLDLALIICCGLIGIFRPSEALAAALGAGLFWESLTAAPRGAYLLILPSAVFLADLMFRRLLSNISWPAFAVLNGLTYLLVYSSLALVMLAAERLQGWAPVAGFGGWLSALLWASLWQVTVAVIGLWLFRFIGGYLKTRYLYARHVRR